MNGIKSIYKVFKKIEEYDELDHTFLDMYIELDRLIKIKIDKENISVDTKNYLINLLYYIDDMLESSRYISIKDYNHYNTTKEEKEEIIKKVGIMSIYKYRFHTYNLILKGDLKWYTYTISFLATSKKKKGFVYC